MAKTPPPTVTPAAAFAGVASPTITSITPSKFATGTVIVIVGTAFIAPVTVTVDGITAAAVVLSSTVVSVTVPGPLTKKRIALTAAGGTVTYVDDRPVQASADFTAPLAGQGITIIPAPTFMYTQVHGIDRFAFDASIWGNVLGTDSSMKKVVNNLLAPQISLFGFKVEGLYRITNLTSSVGVGVSGQINFLLKKVSFYDENTKDVSSVNPFVIHPKVGLTLNFFGGDVFCGAYMNMLNIVSGNADFKNFFQTNKTTFYYPSCNVGGIFDLANGGNQALKLEMDMVINNGETRLLLNNPDKVIPYIKIGIFSKL